MPTPEKLTSDIPLPNQSNRLDPRLNTPWYGDARRRAAAAKSSSPTGTRTGGVGNLVSRAVANYRTFTGSR